jgi:zinc carboxypeptidase
MRTPTPLFAAATAAILIFTGSPAPASAQPNPTPAPPVREFGNGPERNQQELSAATELFQALRAPEQSTAGHGDRGYPRRTVLSVPPVNPDDHSIKLGLVPYHEIASRLNALQRQSNRVSVEIAGQTHLGRDLYLVTVTAPESRSEAAEQARMRAEIENDPADAARDRRLRDRYKAPVFINNNIHGNEWEGTDASLRVIEQLATSNHPSVRHVLRTTRLYFNITANPDGRVAGTRQNTAGFDMNRDFVTSSQPEVRAMQQIMIDTQPLVMLDVHGYVNGTLIEPTTPPHGQNYEYDLFIKHTYANGIGMEEAVNGLGFTPEEDDVFPVQIPFRDFDEGWDDWPPIFTPQYAPFHGAVATHTVEIPLAVNNEEYDELPVDELRRRSAINTDIAEAAIEAAFAYTVDNRRELIADQIEVFRRGAAGEELVVPPLGWVPGFGPEDIWTNEFPRGYVIPAGDGQRSAVAAARLVDFLIASDVRVRRATRSFTLDGTRYPAGSYLVDMRQPKRGMATVLLEAGLDVTPRVGQMYDISGWSHGLLWGATVDVVDTGDPRRVPSRQVLAAAETGEVARNGNLSLRLDDGAEVIALNELLARGVDVSWAGDGTVVVPASARGIARELAERYGVQFDRATGQGSGALPAVTIAAAVASDELFTLQELGFDVVPVSTSILNAGFDWSGVDVLFVSSGLVHSRLNAAARAGLDEFLTRGGVVTRGATGAEFNQATGLLAVTAVEGREDANGVVEVTGFGEHAFVFSPLWFTGLGPEVTVEQSYASEGPLVSGHWRPDEDGAGGQDQAAGQASVVSGLSARGAAVVMFGTEPLFRNHPKGSFAQVARAIYWSALASQLTSTAATI